MSDGVWDAFKYALERITMIPDKKTTYIVFYGEQVYDLNCPWDEVKYLPDGVILYIKAKDNPLNWYKKDYTPMLITDVPETCKAWILLMGK